MVVICLLLCRSTVYVIQLEISIIKCSLDDLTFLLYLLHCLVTLLVCLSVKSVTFPSCFSQFCLLLYKVISDTYVVIQFYRLGQHTLGERKPCDILVVLGYMYNLWDRAIVLKLPWYCQAYLQPNMEWFFQNLCHYQMYILPNMEWFTKL